MPPQWRTRAGARTGAGSDTSIMQPQWAEEVREALIRGDGQALASLFDAAVAAEGRAGATRSWLEAISAFDADAVTG
jgi:hypothetical protein